MKTVRLYDNDAYLSEFSAMVLSCEARESNFKIILDRTAFFPEGGGQDADTGTIGTAKVLDVQIKDDVITHITDAPVSVNKEVMCKINWDTRYRRMQNHSGEHIVSGIAHSLYGCTNVGFHMGKEITVDFDIELNHDQIYEIEKLSNEAVYKNVTISAEYPDPEILKDLDYRSKLDLSDGVRIVTIEGYDKCACCAPHVRKSGEIGIIKILDSMRHRGGTRLFMLSGQDAFEDYCIKTKNLYEIAVKLCAKHNEELPAFRKLCDEVSELKQKCASLSKELTQLKSANGETINGINIFFESEADMPTIRNLALETAKTHEGIAAVFSGNDNSYKYAISSMQTSVKDFSLKLNQKFNGRGGGSDELVQGNICASDEDIRSFFTEM